MPPLSIQWLRGSRDFSLERFTPAERAVRVLQVTRAHWPMADGKRRKRQTAVVQPLGRLAQPQFGV